MGTYINMLIHNIIYNKYIIQQENKTERREYTVKKTL